MDVNTDYPNIEALQVLSRELRRFGSKNSKVRFGMRLWVEDAEFTRFGRKKPNGCGYAACAIGYAASNIPWFKRQGFYMVNDMPRFEYYDGWDAVIRFFQISLSTANWLFSYNSYGKDVTPTLVADRIDCFCKYGY